ncbi:hypothetical protein EVJ58_g6696 [Rhodofomes roseus]|uniref:GPI mannosyltransferase 1 n=1 Tax=Rhodofomes roseus TaxID=34475 RepID=A0A4Y9YAV6_9APHY|nr:hypothetical protein EVJ58_g6696 [Rhodofomes roseus]
MAQRSLVQLVPSFKQLLVISTALRVVLILYSEWHDAHSVVKYTDVDYRVFSDAARFLLNPSEDNYARGPLGKSVRLGDPYTRATYRYTPLLAVLLAPNEWLHPSFGKYLFAAADILAGVLMYNLLTSNTLPTTSSRVNNQQQGSSQAEEKEGAEARDGGWTADRYATALVASHLLSPLVFTISTRGSSESVLSLFVLSTLYFALKGRWNATAILLGLSTHWKIYPFIYGIACLGVIGGSAKQNQRSGNWLSALVNARTLRFTALSVATFVGIGALMYAM